MNWAYKSPDVDLNQQVLMKFTDVLARSLVIFCFFFFLKVIVFRDDH